MSKKQAVLVTALTVAALVLGMLVCGRLWFRLDLTKSGAFTISPVSRNLYAEISEQVRITYFISDKLKGLHPVPGEIEDLLREYAARSHGRITVALKDPIKTGMAEAVQQLGIQGQPMEIVERDQAGVAMVYSGILIEYLDAVEVLPLVFSLDTLEYDLTSRIRTMVRGGNREAGVLVGDPGRSLQTDYASVGQVLAQAGYKVRAVNPGDELGPSLPALVVLGGAGELDDWALYRIDLYVQNGGKVFFLPDAVAVESGYSVSARPVDDRGLLEMLASYGAAVMPSLVLDVSSQVIPVQMQERGYSRYEMIRYPHWVSALAQFALPGHPVTAGFSGLDLFWASPLELNPPDGVEALALFESTPDAWLQTRGFYLDPNQNYYFMLEQEETKGTKVLAGALRGKFPSWFADRPKPVREGSGEELPDMPPRAAESRMIVIGDSDFLAAQSQRNLDFLVRALDWLGNDDDIITIRKREAASGRLDRITDPEKRLERMAAVRLLNVVVVPLLVAGLGVFAAVRRRKLLAAEGEKKTGRNAP